MGASDSDPSLTSGETAAPAGIGPGQRDLVAGRYQLLEHIADGGMGSVYLAQHVLSKQKLALKVVHPYLCKGRQGVERFRREVSAAAEIEHPGIVSVFDAGVDDDGGFFMAMELLKGESLGDRLRRDWPGMATALGIVVEILEPLAKAHAKGFVHRDLKPDNIFLSVDIEGRARVKLLDFGLAREVDKGGPTRTGITFGTPEYMSPEQAMSARKVKPPGDVWSIGVMLYELLSGLHPFHGETPNAIMANAIKEPLPPLRNAAPHVPEPIARFIERSLAKEPENRPESAGQMLDELRAVLATLGPLPETVPAATTPPTSWDDSDDEPAIAISSDFVVPSSRLRAAALVASAEDDAQTIPPSGPLPTHGSPYVRGIAIGAVAGLIAMVGVAVAVVVAMDRSGQDAMTATPMATRGDAVADLVRDDELTPEEPPTGESEVAGAIETDTVIDPSPVAPAVGEEEAASTESPRSAREPRVRRRSTAEPEVETARESGMPAAQICLRSNDKRCAIDALEGGRRGAAETATLIDLYQQTGQIDRALPHVRRFLQRYPDHARADEFRRLQQRFGG